MKKNPALAAYMNCSPETGLDLDHFVEHGGHLLSPSEKSSLLQELPTLHEKIGILQTGNPRLAAQWKLLLDFYEVEPPYLPAQVRNETIFALLYAVKELDLVPDDEPGVGYLDDAAVAESVLSRHSAIFQNHCDFLQIPWSSVEPQYHE